MTNKAIRTLVLAALFAALACVATMVIQIPSPMNGYVNLGDCFVLLAGWILGPLYGTLAAGIGSMLADVFTGYMHYAPGTFLIKAGVALIAWALAKALISRFGGKRSLCKGISAVVAELFMVAGYYFYAGLILGKGLGALGAAASVPGNLIQGAVGAIAATLLSHVIDRYRLLHKFDVNGL
jgi:hypothetical protein